jgi:hypothetical protein
MTEAEITERQVLRVRELTNMTNEQISRIYIMELLKTMYPSEAAEYLVKVVQHYSCTVSSASGTQCTGPFDSAGVSTLHGITDDGLINHAVCWVSATTLGHCTSVVAVDGSCTCN